MFVIKFLLNRLREGFSAFSGRWQVPVVGCSVTRVPGNWSIVPGSQVCTCAACKSVDATRAWSRTGDCQCPGRRLEIFIVRRLNRVQRKCGAEADADVRDSYVPWAWWSESAGKESWHPRESWLRLVNYRCWISISIQILNKQTSTNILCRVIIFIRIKTKFLLENYIGMKIFFFLSLHCANRFFQFYSPSTRQKLRKIIATNTCTSTYSNAQVSMSGNYLRNINVEKVIVSRD